MTKGRRLGRGMDAFFSRTDEAEEEAAPTSEEAPEAGTDSGLRTIAVDAIRPNPLQPRGAIDEDDEALRELAASIESHGLIQPLIVHDNGEGLYTLIAGERRWRASRLAGLESVPVVVKEATPQTMLELALIENIQRADLNALEEAAAYRQLIEEFGLTHEEVAERVGKSRSTITNATRLLDLPPRVQEAVLEGKISGGHARALAGLPTPEAQNHLLGLILKQGLSVRQTEERVRKLKEGVRPQPRQPTRLPPELRDLETTFRRSLGTRVDIQKRGKGGRVVIHYFSDEDLQTIYEAITGE
ncbi:MAG: ParB/RepB/Spo0J family partition protein [Candidatus Promineifilaceae bacterium]|nr:ParB/RepB/Spo0J family partition protein [Candidatus Promineifilaceae bacterium]